MKEEAPSTHKQIANKADKEDRIVPISSATLDTEAREVYEEEIRKSVYYLSSIWRCVVVLRADFSTAPRWDIGKQTSSHQFMVEVTGSQ